MIMESTGSIELMETNGKYWHERYREALDALRRELEQKPELEREKGEGAGEGAGEGGGKDKGRGRDEGERGERECECEGKGWIIACGFTVNLDMVHKLQSRETGQVIEEVMGGDSKRVDEGGPVGISGRSAPGDMPGGTSIAMSCDRPSDAGNIGNAGNTGNAVNLGNAGDPDKMDNASLPRAIRTPQDFIAVLVRLLEDSRGGEWQVATGEVAEWLRARFPGDFKIGGTGAQAANALSSLGFRCILHAPNLSCGQAEHLNSRIGIPRGGDLLTPLEACRESDSDELHCIIEYNPGLEVAVSGRTLRPVTSNRIILPYDRVLSSFKIDGDFINYVLNHAPAISSLLVTGFNALRADEDWMDRVDRVAEFVREFRSRNAMAFIHLEEGDTRCVDGRRYMIEHLYPMMDSVGMNEDEFQDITGVQADRDPVRSVETLVGLLEAHRLKRVNLHTRDFSLSATRLDPGKEQRAQLVASLLAANRARTGSFGDFEAVARNIELPLSMRGLAIERWLEDSIGLAGGRKEIALDRQPGRAWIVFSPARRVERPVCTVGLGDSYTAGILAMY